MPSEQPTFSTIDDILDEYYATKISDCIHMLAEAIRSAGQRDVCKVVDMAKDRLPPPLGESTDVMTIRGAL